MSYMCDVCGTKMESKSQGKFYNQQRVLLNPDYWETALQAHALMWDGIEGDLADNAYGLFIQQALDGTTGFTVCHDCDTVLNDASKKYVEFGLTSFFEEPGIPERDQILVVAATVWERRNGRWPSCIDNKLKKRRGAVAKGRKSRKKWWKF